MTRRFYRRRLDFKSGRFAGFRWQIEREDYHSTSEGIREIKVKIRRRNKLNKPVYSDYMTIKVRMLLIDTLFPDKKSGRTMYGVHEVKVWKGGKKYGDVTYHRERSIGFRRFNGIIVSLMSHLKNHDTAKGWRPPKR